MSRLHVLYIHDIQNVKFDHVHVATQLNCLKNSSDKWQSSSQYWQIMFTQFLALQLCLQFHNTHEQKVGTPDLHLKCMVWSYFDGTVMVKQNI